jgi:hypothetical protein
VAHQVPPYRGPFGSPRLTPMATINSAVSGSVVQGVFNNFGRETVLLEDGQALECMSGRLVLRSQEQTRIMRQQRIKLLREHEAELFTLAGNYEPRHAKTDTRKEIDMTSPFVNLQDPGLESFIGEVSDANSLERQSYRDGRIPRVTRLIDDLVSD